MADEDAPPPRSSEGVAAAGGDDPTKRYELVALLGACAVCAAVCDQWCVAETPPKRRRRARAPRPNNK
jgi:hypothetical protein